MYKQKMYTTKHYKSQKKIWMLLLIVSVLAVSFLTLGSMNDYENPSLTGKWVSTETGETVKFTQDEHVTLSASSLIGTYHIISPNTMEYTIDNLTFTMSYRIEGRYLYWGINDEALECFRRK